MCATEGTHGYFKLRALGVELWLVGRMDGQELVAKEILARLERRRDRGSPATTIVYQLALCPRAIRNTAGEQAGMLDLELYMV